MRSHLPGICAPKPDALFSSEDWIDKELSLRHFDKMSKGGIASGGNGVLEESKLGWRIFKNVRNANKARVM